MMMDAVDNDEKQTVDHLMVGVRLIDLARHFNLDEPTHTALPITKIRARCPEPQRLKQQQLAGSPLPKREDLA